MADVPVLVCTAGELAGRRIPVPEGGLAIGRSPENAVVLHDEGVSRYHGRLLFENGTLWLQDAGSRNGVFVNGVRVTGHKALQVGDAITIAEHTFELRWQDEGEVEFPAVQVVANPVPEPDPTVDYAAPTQPAHRRVDDPALPEPAPVHAVASSTSSTAEPAPRRRWFWPFS